MLFKFIRNKILNYYLNIWVGEQKFHKNLMNFGDSLHKIHPLAGQGFNMTIRDIDTLIQIVKNKISLGLQIDKSVNSEFENKLKHKNLIFSNGVDLVNELFKFERRSNNTLLTKSIQMVASTPVINKIFTKIADKGTTL